MAEAATEHVAVRAARVLFYGGLVSIPWLTLRVGPIAIGDIFFVSSLGVLLFQPVRWHATPLPAPTRAALFLCVVGALLSGFRDPEMIAGIGTIARLVFVWAVWAWLGLQLLRRPAHVARCLLLFGIGCSLSGFAALGQYRFGIEIPGSELTSTLRAAGLAQHPNDQGGALAIGLVIVVATMLSDRRVRAIHLVVACGCVLGLVLAGSVTGMLAAAVGVTAALLRAGLSRRTVVVLVILMAGSTWIGINAQTSSSQGSQAGLSPMERFLVASGQSGASQSDTLTDRIETMKVAWREISTNLFIGRGFSDLSVVGEVFTHNTFLAFWLAGGLSTLAGVLIIWISSLWRALRLGQRSLREPIFGSLICALTFAMTAPIIYQRYAWLPSVLTALAFSLQRPELEPNIRGEASRRCASSE